MPQTTRRAVVLTLVAATLCAQHAVTAAPAARPPVQQMARHMAERLTWSLRPGAAAVRLAPEGRRGAIAARAPAMADAAPAEARHVAGSPFQFRMPPPLA